MTQFKTLMLTHLLRQVNVPKTRRTYCKGKDCKKHTNHKVTQYKAGKVMHHPSRPGLELSLTNNLGLPLRTRKAPIRSQAVRVWWSDKTSVPQKSKDNEEGGAPVRMHAMQDEGAVGAKAVQAFRTWVRSRQSKSGNGDANNFDSGDKKTKGAALVF